MITVTWKRGLAYLPPSTPKPVPHQDSIVVMGRRHHYGKRYMAWQWPSGVRMVDYTVSFTDEPGSNSVRV